MKQSIKHYIPKIPKEIVIAESKPGNWFTKLLWPLLNIQSSVKVIPNPFINQMKAKPLCDLLPRVKYSKEFKGDE
jgi:hypothetical protein